MPKITQPVTRQYDASKMIHAKLIGMGHAMHASVMLPSGIEPGEWLETLDGLLDPFQLYEWEVLA